MMEFDDNGAEIRWIELPAMRRADISYHTNLMIGAIWEGLVLLIGGIHYLTSSRPHSMLGISIFLALIAAGIFPLWRAFTLHKVREYVGDPRIFVNRAELVRGHSFDVRVDQPVQPGIRIDEMRIAILCVETRSIRTQVTTKTGSAEFKEELKAVTLLEKWHTMLRGKEIGKDHVAVARKIRIPADLPPSTNGDRSPENPVIEWKLHLITAPAGAPAYEADFKVHVLAAPTELSWETISDDSIPPGPEPV